MVVRGDGAAGGVPFDENGLEPAGLPVRVEKCRWAEFGRKSGAPGAGHVHTGTRGARRSSGRHAEDDRVNMYASARCPGPGGCRVEIRYGAPPTTDRLGSLSHALSRVARDRSTRGQSTHVQLVLVASTRSAGGRCWTETELDMLRRVLSSMTRRVTQLGPRVAQSWSAYWRCSTWTAAWEQAGIPPRTRRWHRELRGDGLPCVDSLAMRDAAGLAAVTATAASADGPVSGVDGGTRLLCGCRVLHRTTSSGGSWNQTSSPNPPGRATAISSTVPPPIVAYPSRIVLSIGPRICCTRLHKLHHLVTSHAPSWAGENTIDGQVCSSSDRGGKHPPMHV